MSRAVVFVVGLAVGLPLLGIGCKQYRNTPDGLLPIDGAVADALPIDGAPVDADMCGANLFITGQTIDWDSTTTNFLGVFDARWTVEGTSEDTATTAPNGRILLCAPNVALNTITVTPTTVAPPNDYLPAIVVVQQISGEVGQNTPSLRLFTEARAASFFTANSLTYDATKAQVLVYEAGDEVSVSIDSTHDQVLAGDSATDADPLVWTAGSQGRYVLFPNVDIGSGTTNITAPGFASPVALPLAAATISYITQDATISM